MSFLQGLLGPPNIEKLKADRDVKGLIKALSYRSNATIREDAAQALLGLANRKDALNALCEMDDARAVEPLIVLLNSTNEIVAFITISKKLDTLHWQPDRSEAGARYWMAKGRWDKVAEVGAPAVELLIAALSSKVASVRAAATEALGQIGDPAVESLIAHLMKGKTLAALTLGELGDARAVEPLVMALTRGPKHLRGPAATNPIPTAVVGFGGLALIVWLMMFKPF